MSRWKLFVGCGVVIVVALVTGAVLATRLLPSGTARRVKELISGDPEIRRAITPTLDIVTDTIFDGTLVMRGNLVVLPPKTELWARAPMSETPVVESVAKLQGDHLLVVSRRRKAECGFERAWSLVPISGDEIRSYDSEEVMLMEAKRLGIGVTHDRMLWERSR